MIKLSYDESVAKIVEKSELSKEEIETKIKAKMDQLYGLISKEGAAHIIANDLGIKLIEEQDIKNLQIKNILNGMTNVEIAGKVLQKYDVREFDSNGRQGKVASIVLGDETGTIRLVLWNEHADLSNSFNQGDILKVNGAYVRERNDQREIHLSSKGEINVNPEGVTINATAPATQSSTAARKKLAEISDSDSMVEVMGTVVQLYNLRFYEVCPNCQKRARPNESGFACASHGVVSPSYGYVTNVFLDDGTENIRVACFNDQTQQLLNKKDEELQVYRETPESFEAVKNELLGSFVKVTGRVKKNDMTQRYEITANSISAANPDEEIKLANKTE